MIKTYRVKLVEVQAEQFTAKGDATLFAICACYDPKVAGKAHVHAWDGPQAIAFGDWVVKGADGNVSVLKPAAFEKAYELAEEEAP